MKIKLWINDKVYNDTIEPDMMLNAVPNEKYEPAGIFSSVG